MQKRFRIDGAHFRWSCSARSRSRWGDSAFSCIALVLRTGIASVSRSTWAIPLLILLAGCGDAESAVARGDRLWADSNYTAALAEYRLGHDRSRNDDAVLARVAHAYAVTGQFERARESYDDLLARAPGYEDQAIFDYLALAERARSRADRYGMAGAVESALALRPGLAVGDMAAPLAGYYARAGDADRAQVFYERALAYAPPDSMPTLLYEFAQFQESQGNCADAVALFTAFRAREQTGTRADQARWNIGNCSFTLAREARQEGEADTALRHIDTVIDLGVPQNLVDQAWFERGEVLLDLGRDAEALDAFVRVLETLRPGSSQLAARARQRIDEIRFDR